MPKYASLIVLVAFHLGATQPSWSQSTADTYFSEAYQAYNRKQYTTAKRLLDSALNEKGSVLRDYTLYYLGRVATAVADPEGARAWFTQLEREYPNSRWANDAAFHVVRIDIEQKRYRRAIEQARSLLKQGTNRQVEARALLYLGQAYEGLGQHQQAFQHYQDLRRKAPQSKWNTRGRKRIAVLRKAYPELRLSSDKALLAEARQLLQERDYAAAERVYLRVLKESNFRRLSLHGLSKVYRKTRQRLKEEAILRDVVRHYSGTADAAGALARIATIEWNRDENESALRTFRTLKAQFPRHSQVAFASYAIGRIHESRGDWDTAVRIYQSFPASYPRSRYRADAAWRLAWIHYLRADYVAAYASFRKIAARPGNFNTAATFWQARTAAALGKEAEATRLRWRLARSSKNPYYRGLSRASLAEPEAPSADGPPATGTPRLAAPIRLNPRASFHFTRAKALAGLSLNRFARLELDRVKASSPDTADLKRFLMREYAAVQAFDASVALAHNLPTSDETVRHRFPLSYWNIVLRHADAYDVDPFLVAALIRQESLFNPGAVSPANALGLMQLLHKTARTEAKSLGLPEPQRARLFDPNVNIQLGTHHLKRLLKRYSDSQVKALAAYNAGRKPVERWSKDFATATDTEFTERIPYKETRLYVKKVLRNYWVYKRLYEGERQHENGTTRQHTDTTTDRTTDESPH